MIAIPRRSKRVEVTSGRLLSRLRPTQPTTGSDRMRIAIMRLRPLAFFTLTVALTVLAGQVGPTEAAAQVQKEKKGKKGKKNKRFDPPMALPAPSSNPTATTKPPAPNFTPLAIPTSKDAAALARLIDGEIAKKLSDAKIKPSPISSDDEFLRRAYLDITGVIPTAEQGRGLPRRHDRRTSARSCIDELLASPHYGRRMADIWTAKLFPRDSANRFVTREPLYKWFEEEFNQNEPLGQARDEPRDRDRHRRGEPGRHLLPRQPLRSTS